MTFTHPLARAATVRPTGGLKGKTKQMLVIVTTLHLDKDHPKFKQDKFDALSAAAKKWINDTGQAKDFIMMNRPKTWIGDKDGRP